MNIDLFGNKIERQILTTDQRMSGRQVSLTGRDLYTTDTKDVERFLIALKRDGIEILNPIWEPAAGTGCISKTLANYGHKVYSTDIYPYIDEDITIQEKDFFNADLNTNNFKTIFTNPPYNCKEDFLLKALSFNVDVIFLVRLTFLASIRRYKIFKKYHPSYVYVYSARAHCYKDGDTSIVNSLAEYCIMMWKPPYNQDTIVRWIE